MAKAKDKIEEFIWVCNGFFGIYMHSIWGFNLLKKSAEKTLLENKETKVPHMAFIPYDKSKAKIPDGLKVDDFLSKFMTVTKADDLRDQNEINAVNYNFIGQMLLVNIFQHWDERYRKLIATELGLNQMNDLKIDFFGDIRFLRQAIIHNKGIATSDMEKCKILKWFKHNERINISYENIMFIKNYIITELRKDCELLINKST